MCSVRPAEAVGSLPLCSAPPPPTALRAATTATAHCCAGALAGDALGAAVEGWSSERIASAFPDGLTGLQHSVRGCDLMQQLATPLHAAQHARAHAGLAATPTTARCCLRWQLVS